jgi:hypothetical protein
VITTIVLAGLIVTPADSLRRPPAPPPHDLEHPTQREMSEPGWRPWLRWDWCTDARGVRFRCQRWPSSVSKDFWGFDVV